MIKHGKEFVLGIIILTIAVSTALVILYIPNIMSSNIPILEEEEVVIPLRNGLENEILVGGLENKFIHVERVLFGVGVGGGLGAPQIRCSSIDNFIEMVPENETVYTSFETRDMRDIFWKGSKRTQARHSFTKIYWAFIENRAGMIFFEDNYQYKDNNGRAFFVEKYDSESVTFRWTNRFHVEYYSEIMEKGTFLISAGAIIAGLLLLCGIFFYYMEAKKGYFRYKDMDNSKFFEYAGWTIFIDIVMFLVCFYLL